MVKHNNTVFSSSGWSYVCLHLHGKSVHILSRWCERQHSERYSSMGRLLWAKVQEQERLDTQPSSYLGKEWKEILYNSYLLCVCCYLMCDLWVLPLLCRIMCLVLCVVLQISKCTFQQVMSECLPVDVSTIRVRQQLLSSLFSFLLFSSATAPVTSALSVLLWYSSLTTPCSHGASLPWYFPWSHNNSNGKGL